MFTTWSPSNGFTICNQRWRTLKRQVIILSEFFNQQKWKTSRWKSIKCKAFGLWMSDNRGWHVFNRFMSVESDTIIYIFRQISKLSSVRFVIFEIQCNCWKTQVRSRIQARCQVIYGKSASMGETWARDYPTSSHSPLSVPSVVFVVGIKEGSLIPNTLHRLLLINLFFYLIYI